MGKGRYSLFDEAVFFDDILERFVGICFKIPQRAIEIKENMLVLFHSRFSADKGNNIIALSVKNVFALRLTPEEIIAFRKWAAGNFVGATVIGLD